MLRHVPSDLSAVSSLSRTRYRPLPWRQCRYEHPDTLSRGGLNRPRFDRSAFHVAQQSFDNQPHEKEAQLRVLVIQAVDLLVGHLVQLAVGVAQHRHRAHLLG